MQQDLILISESSSKEVYSQSIRFRGRIFPTSLCTVFGRLKTQITYMTHNSTLLLSMLNTYWEDTCDESIQIFIGDVTINVSNTGLYYKISRETEGKLWRRNSFRVTSWDWTASWLFTKYGTASHVWSCIRWADGALTDWFEVVIIKFVHCDTVLEIYHFNPRSYHKIF